MSDKEVTLEGAHIEELLNYTADMARAQAGVVTQLKVMHRLEVQNLKQKISELEEEIANNHEVKGEVK
jgi:hypothetical protein